jgi:C-methyltransferase-like protein/methyltransferase family protein/putative zinc binding protein
MSGMYTNIANCRVCARPDPVEILAFGPMPLANALVPPSRLSEDEAKIPLTTLFCPECSLVQIRETVDPRILFPADYPFFSSISDAWLRHARANVLELVESRQLDASSLAVEIGSNDGYLLRNYRDCGVPTLGIDPASGPSATARRIGIPVRETFFGRACAESLVAEKLRADVIHANNVFAHVSDLSGVVDGIRLLLKDDGVAVIEVPYVRDLVDHCEFDTIYHEHLCYFSVSALSRLFERHDLVLVDVRRLSTYGGSLRLYVQRSGTPSAAVERLVAEEDAVGLRRLDYYQDFAARVKTIQATLKLLLESLKSEGKKIAAYGVAAKGAILLNSGAIDARLLEYAVDRNPQKQGKCMPGVHLPIYDPSKLLEVPVPDYLLLLAWNFKEEIMEQQLEFSMSGGRFIVPIPIPTIVTDARQGVIGS